MMKISGNYLLINFQQAIVWTIYSLEVAEMELIVINSLAACINTFFLILYLYVQWKFSRFAFTMFVVMTLPIPVLVGLFLTSSRTGLLAMLMQVFSYAVSLDSVSQTLKTRDSSTVNMALIGAASLNGTVWGIYAIMIGDMYVFLP